MLENKVKNRIDNLDFLRAVAAIAVVVFHTSSTMADGDSVRIIISTLLNWCVPVFLMITGALFLQTSRQKSYSDIIKHNIKRIAVAVLVWGFTYNIICNVIIERSFSISVILNSLKMVFVADTKYCYQFWYLYVLIGIYLLIPVIKSWTDKNITKENISPDAKLFCSVFFVISILLPTCLKIADVDITVWHGAFLPFSSYIFYVLMGHILMSKRLDKVIRYILCGTLFIQIALIIYFSFTGNNIWADKITGYSSFFTFNITALLFDSVMRIDFNRLSEKFRKIYYLVADCSFGIYIFHVIILQILRKAGLTYELLGSFIFVPVVSVITILTCTLGTFVCKKIPLLRKTV